MNELEEILSRLLADIEGLHEIWLRGETGQATAVEVVQMICEHRRRMAGIEELNCIKALNNDT